MSGASPRAPSGPASGPADSAAGEIWRGARARYGRGESRGVILVDLLIAEIGERRARGPVRVLDIGCGWSLDGDAELQRRVAESSDAYVGVEPDRAISVQPIFERCHRGPLEDADIAPGSIDVAFSAMVLEHVTDPARHWRAIHQVLGPGGVFLGLTMDRRHWIPKAAELAERLGVRERYLRRRRGRTLPENYPTFYRTNTPRDIARWAREFRSVESLSLTGSGFADTYLPRGLRWAGRWLDRFYALAGIGAPLLVKVVK